MEHKHTNRLIHESSPYLLQHAHNPVDWYPWGEEALQKARDEDKLLLISIGYSACHWCHVMERESFEDEGVAKIMNQHFVCIKVDREERPDVDHLYMDACNLMTGRGGWPLNAFALPDGRPVYAGTYFPKAQWTGVLHHMAGDYKRKRADFETYAEKLLNGIKAMGLVDMPDTEPAFTRKQLDQVYESNARLFDKTWGGKGRAPKFPMPDIYLFLLRYHHYTGNMDALNQVWLTLDKMAAGGIYDQLGGGFARYSTDEEWKVPHFEKMLYDNGQLLALYSEAYAQGALPLYKQVVSQTADWLQREMTSPEGAFYAALDADSEGKEGKFYIWTKEEIKEVVGELDHELAAYALGLEGEGYWEEEDAYIPVMHHNVADLAEKFKLTESETASRLNNIKTKLLEARSKRVRPGLDDKILFSWNCLTIRGLLEAWKTFGDERYRSMADSAFGFLRSRMKDVNRLYRTFKNDKAAIPAFLEDYALYISCLITYYQLDFDAQYLEEAEALTEYVISSFGDGEELFFYFSTAESSELAARKIEIQDNVIASPNSIMARNLYYLGTLLERTEWIARADRMLQAALPQALEFGAFFSNWAILLIERVAPLREVVFAGEKAEQMSRSFSKRYFPLTLNAAATQDTEFPPVLKMRFQAGKERIFICEAGACQMPVSTIEEAWAQMKYNN